MSKNNKSEAADKPYLSKRQHEVLQELAKGLSDQEIANSFFISVNTVKTHVRNIRQALEVQSRTEAVLRGMQLGLIVIDAPQQEKPVTESFKPAPIPPSSLPNLLAWQRIYFGIAIVVALLVFAVPTIKPTIGQEETNTAILSNTCTAISKTKNSDNRWEYVTEMPTARSGLTVVTHDNILYVIGGSRTSGVTSLVETYNYDTGLWHEVASKPTPVMYMQGIVIQDEIYVPGGCQADITNTKQTPITDQLDIFQIETNQWRQGSPLPQPLCAYTAAAYDDKLYLIGGWSGQTFLDTVYVYTPDDDQWQLLESSYPLKIGFAGGATFQNRLYVVGGYDGEQSYHDAYYHDFETNQWLPAPTLNHGLSGHGVITLNNRLYAIGGGMKTPIDSMQSLTTDDTAWQELQSPYSGSWHNLSITTVDTRIFAVGGWCDKRLDTIYQYQTSFKVFIPFSRQ
ncbi:MAG: hypothetical protein B6242_03570 [Anaerolineaceae bacterium 4572_78]|nr:MAG: hypothetical protein B6242_03570 [Anaerolineaceae bacterium 4572_78]